VIFPKTCPERSIKKPYNRRKKMRKFWIVLLSIGLLVALAAPVFAVDVKFSGSYVIQGYMESNRNITDGSPLHQDSGRDGPSDSFTWQRLRMQTDFTVAEGLTLTTRFDAMEKVWGTPRSGTALATNDANGIQSTGSAEAENIKFQHVYATFKTAIGTFSAGYMAQTAWGTAFGDSSDYAYGPRLRWRLDSGPLAFLLIWDKYEGQNGSYPTGGQVDQSKDKYSAAFIYNWGKGSAGLLGQFARDTNSSGATPAGNAINSQDNGLKKTVFLLDPYVKATFGPVYFEAEVIWVTGKLREWESTSTRPDITYNGLSAYANAMVTLGPAYVGAAFVYVSGDDAGTTDKIEAGIPAGADFNPCLILGNYDLARWSAPLGGALNTALTSSVANPLGGVNGVGMENVIALQIYAGVKPMPKLDTKVSLTYAQTDKTPNTSNQTLAWTNLTNNGTDGAWVSKDLGWEADVTATYKIYDNLSYMVGFGYLWAGDAFKLTNPNTTIKNDYLLTHKLTLSF
jgi:hypothetical protein